MHESIQTAWHQPGIVAALPGEARALARLRAMGQAELASGAWLMLSGMGAQRAHDAARALVARGVDGLVSWGSAAALAPALAPGDLVLAREIIAADGHRFEANERWRAQIAARVAERVRIREGAIAESRDLLVDVAGKAALHAANSAVACDMESAAVAAVAADFGIPFVAIRAIVDDATMILPPAARAAVDESGALSPVALLRALAGRPSSMHAQLRALKQLGVAFKAAQITLSAVAPVLRDRPGT